MSCLKVDLLTVAIGPEHHDIRLLDRRNVNQIGRVSFNIVCHHVENITLAIKSLQCKVLHLVQNDIALRLRFKKVSSNII
jgi:hypothetical protein